MADLPKLFAEPSDELLFILGRPCFLFIEEAKIFRALGYKIETKAEAEQAFFIHKMLCCYIKNPVGWREDFNNFMRQKFAQYREGKTQ